jgi:hypothetical protein
MLTKAGRLETMHLMREIKRDIIIPLLPAYDKDALDETANSQLHILKNCADATASPKSYPLTLFD